LQNDVCYIQYMIIGSLTALQVAMICCIIVKGHSSENEYLVFPFQFWSISSNAVVCTLPEKDVSTVIVKHVVDTNDSIKSISVLIR